MNQYRWLDHELLWNISIFDIMAIVKGDLIKLGSPCDWSVLPVDLKKRIFSCFDRCYVPFDECKFTHLNFRLLFNGSEEALLKPLKITHSQLYLKARTFVNVFQFWCEYQNQKPCVNLFFHLFSVMCTS